MKNAKNYFCVAPGKWVRIEILEPRYGFTQNAVQKYRDNGIWTLGTHFKKDPVGRYIFNVEAIDQWLEQSR